MGAKAIWLGRLWAYALAAGGEPADFVMLTALKREFQVTMSPAGCRDCLG
jgi:isopentenyl diphosphate isomerase/L-lactate dehydrogenase-like FMN-dependent dehydrogenase